MKKIMFNDRYGLTQAVIEGRKTMTRRLAASSPSKHFSLKRLKKFQYQGKIDYIWDKQHGQHNDYQSQRIS